MNWGLKYKATRYKPKLGDLVAARRHVGGGKPPEILLGMIVKNALIDWQVEWYSDSIKIPNPWYGPDDLHHMREVYLEVRKKL